MPMITEDQIDEEWRMYLSLMSKEAKDAINSLRLEGMLSDKESMRLYLLFDQGKITKEEYFRFTCRHIGLDEEKTEEICASICEKN